ncbi:MAG: tetratricopeptide repeat protein [Nitrospirota bacterium]
MLNDSKIKYFIEYSLGILALIGIFLFLQLGMSGELYDPDIWLHLKTGEYIMQHGAAPQTDIYSASVNGKEWINHSSLTQVIFYAVFNLAGADGLIFFSAILMLLAFLLLFLGIYKNRSVFTLSIVVLTLTIFASKIRFNIRPENFSVLFFCAFLFILTRQINKKWVFFLPLIQLAWVNCHGFFVLGPLLVGLFLIGERSKMQEKAYRNLMLAFLLTMLVCLVNPYGIKGALYPLTVVSKTIFSSPAINNKIIELFPPWRLSFSQVGAYYTLLIVSFASFLFNLRKINFTYLFSWLVFLAVSFNINRNIIFFNCLACIATADNFSRMDFKESISKLFPDRLIFLLKCLILAFITVVSVKYSLSLLDDSYYIFSENRVKSSLLGEARGIYPDKAVDFLLKNKLPDNLFNVFSHGSYLIYRLAPGNHVFVDGRTELYNNDFFRDYYRIFNADKPTIDGLLRQYKINTILLSGNFYPDLEELIKYLSQNKDWSLVYLNDDGLIFMRPTAENKALAAKLRVDLDKWEISRADLKQINLQHVDPAPYSKLAQMLYALGADEKARMQAKEALDILPSNAAACAVLGKIYLHQGDLSQAYQYLRLASIYAPDRLSTLSGLSDYYLQIKDNKNAEKIFKKIVKIHLRYAKGYYRLGIYYENSGDLKNAIKYLRKAVELAPYSTEYPDKLKDVAAKIKGP